MSVSKFASLFFSEQKSDRRQRDALHQGWWERKEDIKTKSLQMLGPDLQLPGLARSHLETFGMEFLSFNDLAEFTSSDRSDVAVKNTSERFFFEARDIIYHEFCEQLLEMFKRVDYFSVTLDRYSSMFLQLLYWILDSIK